MRFAIKPLRQFKAESIEFLKNHFWFQNSILSLSEFGIRIPDDVSMLGIEGDYFAPALNPPPTYFVHDYDTFTDIAMEFITSHGERANGQYSVSYKLIQGKSIKKMEKE